MRLKHPGSKAEDWVDFVSAQRAIDLDGDGTEDLLLDGGAAHITHTYFIYIMRGGCGHYLGTYELDFSPGRLDTSHNGLFDLGGDMPCLPTCCSTITTREMEFDGWRYRVVRSRKREIDCPDFF